MRSSTKVLPPVDEYESDEPIRTKSQQPRKREYNKRHSVESRQPLLPSHDENRRRVEHAYANVEPPIKKNVRFSKRTQSLDYIETNFPFESPSDARRKKKQPTSKSPKSNKKTTNNKRYSKDWSSSGEELCTDEFFINVNYGNQKQSTGATPVKVPPQKLPKPGVALKRTPSSVSSPNLVFDPISNTARIVYEENFDEPPRPCRKQGNRIIHTSTCDGRSCQRVYLNETSL